MTTTTNTDRAELNIASWITLERLLFGAILALGAGVRLFELAAQPLSPVEAANAWSAWLQATGLADAIAAQSVEAPTSALLFSLQTLVFWLAGGGDAPARLVPALAGIALVALPWLWRPWLGRTVALCLAFLIAVDPWLVAFSRHADGVSLSLLFFATTLTCLVRLDGPQLRDSQRRRYWAVLALSFGLLLTSGALAYSLMPILLLFVWRYGLPALRLPEGGSTEGDVDGDERQTMLMLAALFAAGLLLGSTAWFSHPQGLATVGDSVGQWVQQLIGSSPYTLSWALFRIVADEPLVIVLGIVGLWLLWRKSGPTIVDGKNNDGQSDDGVDSRRAWAIFLTLWAVWGIVLLILPGRNPSSLLVVHGALLLAAGHFLGAFIDDYPSDIDWTEGVIVLAVAAVLLLSTIFWLRILIVAPDFSSRVAAICLLLVAALILLIAAYSVWAGWPKARWLGGLILTTLLLVANLSSLLQLNQINDVVTPDGLFARTAHPEVRQLAADVATLSAQRIGDPGEIPIQAQRIATIDPVLAWYLRDMRRLDWVLSPDMSIDGNYDPLAITIASDAGGAGLGLAADSYLGGEYAIQADWLPSMIFDAPIVVQEPAEQSGAGQRLQGTVDAYWIQRAQPLLRWLLFREVKNPAAPESVILWVPAE